MASAPTGDHSHGNRSGRRAQHTELQHIEWVFLLKRIRSVLHFVSVLLKNGLIVGKSVYITSVVFKKYMESDRIY